MVTEFWNEPKYFGIINDFTWEGALILPSCYDNQYFYFWSPYDIISHIFLSCGKIIRNQVKT